MMSPSLNTPASEIDGARIVEWAWPGAKPFGLVQGQDGVKIYGLAIGTYDDNKFYRLSCDRKWASQQDSIYDSVEDAKNFLPEQYRNVEALWSTV